MEFINTLFTPETLNLLNVAGAVILIDILLAGDNAIIIGIAASGFPPQQRRQILIVGVGIALISRIIFALLATKLLEVHIALVIGGLLLYYISWKMFWDIRNMASQAEGGEETKVVTKSYWAAVASVTIADITMSLDNVVGVAAIARDHPYIMVGGLVLSVALMGVSAEFFSRLIKRYPWIGYIGVIILLYVSTDLIYDGAIGLGWA